MPCSSQLVRLLDHCSVLTIRFFVYIFTIVDIRHCAPYLLTILACPKRNQNFMMLRLMFCLNSELLKKNWFDLTVFSSISSTFTHQTSSKRDYCRFCIQNRFKFCIFLLLPKIMNNAKKGLEECLNELKLSEDFRLQTTLIS